MIFLFRLLSQSEENQNDSITLKETGETIDQTSQQTEIRELPAEVILINNVDNLNLNGNNGTNNLEETNNNLNLTNGKNQKSPEMIIENESLVNEFGGRNVDNTM